MAAPLAPAPEEHPGEPPAAHFALADFLTGPECFLDCLSAWSGLAIRGTAVTLNEGARGASPAPPCRPADAMRFALEALDAAARAWPGRRGDSAETARLQYAAAHVMLARLPLLYLVDERIAAAELADSVGRRVVSLMQHCRPRPEGAVLHERARAAAMLLACLHDVREAAEALRDPGDAAARLFVPPHEQCFRETQAWAHGAAQAESRGRTWMCRARARPACPH